MTVTTIRKIGHSIYVRLPPLIRGALRGGEDAKLWKERGPRGQERIIIEILNHDQGEG